MEAYHFNGAAKPSIKSLEEKFFAQELDPQECLTAFLQSTEFDSLCKKASEIHC